MTAKGQYVIRQGNDVAQAWDALGDRTPLIAEGFVHFGREVSIIAVRSQTGDIKTYPLVENHHHEGVLSHTFAPAPDTCSIDAQAKHAITKLLEHFNYVGVLALELFVVSKDGQHHILANEIAPRVHNSGHWSIEGAVCSQFENHMRAVAGLPLGSTAVVKPSVMVNIVSSHPKTEAVLAIDGAHLHLYRKSERTGRKLGHITLLPVNSECLTDSLAQVKSILPETMGL